MACLPHPTPELKHAVQVSWSATLLGAAVGLSKGQKSYPLPPNNPTLSLRTAGVGLPPGGVRKPVSLEAGLRISSEAAQMLNLEQVI